jgi:hypothetical protein
MLIMPCRASASRCRVQVTSNVRPAKSRHGLLALQTRAPEPACVKFLGHRGRRVSVRNEVRSFRLRLRRPACWFAKAFFGFREFGHRGPASPNEKSIQQPASAGAPGSKREFSVQRSEVLCQSQRVHGILQPSVRPIGMQLLARRPNHSVKATPNGAPPCPGGERCAHCSPPGQVVAPSGSPYLKR